MHEKSLLHEKNKKSKRFFSIAQDLNTFLILNITKKICKKYDLNLLYTKFNAEKNDHDSSSKRIYYWELRPSQNLKEFLFNNFSSKFFQTFRENKNFENLFDEKEKFISAQTVYLNQNYFFQIVHVEKEEGGKIYLFPLFFKGNLNFYFYYCLPFEERIRFIFMFQDVLMVVLENQELVMVYFDFYNRSSKLGKLLLGIISNYDDDKKNVATTEDFDNFEYEIREKQIDLDFTVSIKLDYKIKNYFFIENIETFQQEQDKDEKNTTNMIRNKINNEIFGLLLKNHSIVICSVKDKTIKNVLLSVNSDIITICLNKSLDIFLVFSVLGEIFLFSSISSCLINILKFKNYETINNFPQTCSNHFQSLLNYNEFKKINKFEISKFHTILEFWKNSDENMIDFFNLRNDDSLEHTLLSLKSINSFSNDESGNILLCKLKENFLKILQSYNDLDAAALLNIFQNKKMNSGTIISIDSKQNILNFHDLSKNSIGNKDPILIQQRMSHFHSILSFLYPWKELNLDDNIKMNMINYKISVFKLNLVKKGLGDSFSIDFCNSKNKATESKNLISLFLFEYLTTSEKKKNLNVIPKSVNFDSLLKNVDLFIFFSFAFEDEIFCINSIYFFLSQIKEKYNLENLKILLQRDILYTKVKRIETLSKIETLLLLIVGYFNENDGQINKLILDRILDVINLKNLIIAPNLICCIMKLFIDNYVKMKQYIYKPRQCLEKIINFYYYFVLADNYKFLDKDAKLIETKFDEEKIKNNSEYKFYIIKSQKEDIRKKIKRMLLKYLFLSNKKKIIFK